MLLLQTTSPVRTTHVQRLHTRNTFCAESAENNCQLNYVPQIPSWFPDKMVVVQNQDQRSINHQFGAVTGLNAGFTFVLVPDTTLLGIVTIKKFILCFFSQWTSFKWDRHRHPTRGLATWSRNVKKKNCIYTHMYIYQNMNTLSRGVI